MSSVFSAESSTTGLSSRGERGVALMEVLVSMGILAVASLGVYLSTITALRTAKHTEVHYAASSLAASKMEELASVDIANLDSSFNENLSSVSWPGLTLTFQRVTTITVNGDDSRTLNVKVDSNHALYPAKVRFQTTIAKWE